MRADRLISLLMLLQTRGRMTAQALAAELEVSPRTIYRDVDALGAAGIPVTAESGPGGGIGLIDSYRTTLTGLTDGELRALFMLGVPEPLSRLGVSDRLRAALLKLAAALPADRQHSGSQARQRIHLDSAWWFQSGDSPTQLQTLYQAAWQDCRVHITRALKGGPLRDARVEQVVDPYGLVAKANAWYLVCAAGGGMQVHRISHITEARILPDSFARPDGFDLAAFWADWRAGYERSRPRYPVTARVARHLAPVLAEYLGERVAVAPAPETEPDVGGWIAVVLTFEALEEARSRLLGLGGAVEVLAPEVLRRSIADFAAQITARYVDL